MSSPQVLKNIVLTAFVGFSIAVGEANAQAPHRWKLAHRIDSLLTVRYRNMNVDTLYITRPQTKWMLKGRLNVSGASIVANGTERDHRFESEMRSDYKSTVSLGVSYLGLSLSMALNPAKMLGHYQDFELNVNAYGKRFGFDFIYQNAHNFKGWHQVEGLERTELPSDMLALKTLNFNTYYSFNNRRFSYPAAFAQNYIQRRSAGSFLLAASAQGQSGTVDLDGQDFRFTMTNIGVGAGYGYNYVPSKGWLMHISGLPTFIVYSNTSLTFHDTRVPLNYHFPEVIITGRGAIVKQLSPSAFAGLTMVFNFTNIGDDEDLSVRNIKWRTRLFYGIRF
ncbi:MAG: DUF4421 domain-containing protein [Prevotella sp.]|nr:DUF4421 domain-containing protein [Prevotella sp.]